MTEAEHESFFVSESLRDILDKDDLVESSIELQAKEESKTSLLGKFVKLSLAAGTMTVSVSSGMAKILLQNPMTEFHFSFMDEVWQLSSAGLEISSRQNGELHVTLAVTGRN